MQGLVVVVSLFRPSRNRSTCLWVGVGIGVVLIVAMVLVVARIGSSTGDGQSDTKNSDADRYVRACLKVVWALPHPPRFLIVLEVVFLQLQRSCHGPSWCGGCHKQSCGQGGHGDTQGWWQRSGCCRLDAVDSTCDVGSSSLLPIPSFPALLFCTQLLYSSCWPWHSQRALALEEAYSLCTMMPRLTA